MVIDAPPDHGEQHHEGELPEVAQVAAIGGRFLQRPVPVDGRDQVGDANFDAALQLGSQFRLLGW